ncbi:MAG: hypothetical protein AAGE99_06085 [Chlamydiota bacterium]
MLRYIFSSLLLIAFSLHGNAQVAPTAAVDSLLSELSQELEDRINQVFDRSSILAFDVRSQTLVVAENLQFMSEQFVGKTFEELNKQQRKLVNDAQALIDSFDADIDDTVVALEQISLSMNDAFGTLPFSKTFPRVTDYGPDFIVADPQKTIDVTVKGSWIGSGSPKLNFGDVICKRVSKTEVNLIFTCPGEIFSNGAAEFEDAKGTLRVFGRKRFLWSSREKRSYDIYVRGVPQSPATMSLEWVVSADVNERRDRTESFSHRNDHCQGDTNVCWEVNADRANDWSIDVATVSAEATVKSSNSSFNGVEKLSSSGFCLRAIIRNNGSCAPRVFGERAYVDGRGTVHAKASVQEFRTVKGSQLVEAEGQTARWDSDLLFEMPEDYQGFRASILQFDGKTKVASGSMRSDLFTVRTDENAKVVIVRFAKPGSYLNSAIE